MNENYSPDEIRLLDEFAAVALPTLTWMVDAESMAVRSYTLATAMIAERRKRVGSQPPSPRPYAEVRRDLGLPEPTQPQPQPEQQPGGELTEGAVKKWQCEAERVEITWGGYRVDGIEIDRAVALQILEAHKRALANGADDLRAADAATTKARGDAKSWHSCYDSAIKERDEVRAALADIKLTMEFAHASAVHAATARKIAPGLYAEFDGVRAQLADAQPVLDAVAHSNLFNPPSVWDSENNKAMQAYADRRRNEERANQQGGAS